MGSRRCRAHYRASCLIPPHRPQAGRTTRTHARHLDGRHATPGSTRRWPFHADAQCRRHGGWSWPSRRDISRRGSAERRRAPSARSMSFFDFAAREKKREKLAYIDAAASARAPSHFSSAPPGRWRATLRPIASVTPPRGEPSFKHARAMPTSAYRLRCHHFGLRMCASSILSRRRYAGFFPSGFRRRA